MIASRTVGCVAVALGIIGLLFSQWLLFFFGIVLALVMGNWIVALGMAFMADLLFGAPVGMLHRVLLPFTFFSLFFIAARVFLMRQLRHAGPMKL